MQQFRRSLMLHHDVERSQAVGICAVTLENLSGKCALQRSKTKNLFLVPPQHKLHETIA